MTTPARPARKGGKRPRAPELQELSGARPSRINKKAPKYSDASGEPPDDLSDEGKKVWFRTVPELRKFHLLNKVEVESLVCYCEAVVTHRAAVDDIRNDGVTTTGSMGGLVKNPACTVAAENARVIRSFAVEFGLTPAARQNVQVPDGTASAGPASAPEDFFSETG